MTEKIIIGKQGVDVSGTLSPNDTIIDTQYNTFKIISSGTVAGTVAGGSGLSSLGTVSTAHGLPYTPTSIGFMRYSTDGVVPPGNRGGFFNNYYLNSVSADGTNVYFEIDNRMSGTQTFNCYYQLYEAPLNESTGGSINLSDHNIRVVKNGFDASSETDPNNYNFLSGYNTLKYYDAGSVVISGSAVFPFENDFSGSAVHNLGYHPFAVMYASFTGGSRYYPFGGVVGNMVIQRANMTIGTSNLSFTYSIGNFSGGTVSGTATFFYKIFKNRLDL